MTATPLAPTTALLDAFKAEHDALHQLWREHVIYGRCARCMDGRRCREADDLCDRANAAGLKWERAERETPLPSREGL